MSGIEDCKFRNEKMLRFRNLDNDDRYGHTVDKFDGKAWDFAFKYFRNSVIDQNDLLEEIERQLNKA